MGTQAETRECGAARLCLSGQPSRRERRRIADAPVCLQAPHAFKCCSSEPTWRVLFAFPFTSWATLMDILPPQKCYEAGPGNDWYARRLDHTFLKSQHVTRAKSDFSRHQRSTVSKPKSEQRRLSRSPSGLPGAGHTKSKSDTEDT